MKTLILAATALALTMGVAQADTFKTIWNQPVDSVANVAGDARVTSNRGDCVNGTLQAHVGQCVNDSLPSDRAAVRDADLREAEGTAPDPEPSA